MCGSLFAVTESVLGVSRGPRRNTDPKVGSFYAREVCLCFGKGRDLERRAIVNVMWLHSGLRFGGVFNGSV